MRLPLCAASGIWLSMVTVCVGSGPAVNESARQIPVAYQVDVLVVGGSTGAVAAAVAAAQSGAKVFLATPLPYLGDDMTATLRLWLDPREAADSPLAAELYADERIQSRADPLRLDYTYTSDKSSKPHADSNPPSMLSNGKWGDPVRQSVQYDQNAQITADLGKRQAVTGVRIATYQYGGSQDARVKQVTVSTSDDGRNWEESAVIEDERAQDSGATRVYFTALRLQTRYIRLFVEKPTGAKRVLLGQVEILGPETNRTASQPSLTRPRPLHVKKVLDEALLKAGVQYLYGCYATDVLRDTQGKVCGIAMNNRAGRQAVIAKSVIDATERAWVARLAGARFRPFPAGIHRLHRVVIGGEVQAGEGVTAQVVDPPFRGPYPNAARTSSSQFKVIDYTLELPIASDTPSAWAAAEQQARTLTYHPEQQFTSDALFEVPLDTLYAQQPATGQWQGVDAVPLRALYPAEVERVFVLGGCADVPREQAERMLRPPVLIRLGMRVGQAAAAEARSLPSPAGVRLSGQPVDSPAAPGDIRESLSGTRPTLQLRTVPETRKALPVLGRYDVVVVGGGTAGAPAAIGAARQKAKTLVVEYQHGLGGVGTLGAITRYFGGNHVGFLATVPGGSSWVAEQKMEWFRQELLKAGGEIWFGCLGCGVLLDDNRVIGVVVATPHGRGVVLATTVIDATGGADIAAAAGAKCIHSEQPEFAMQGTGLPGLNLGATYVNTDFTFVDETDMADVWHVFVYAKQKYPDAFDQGKLVDTRERRRIDGQFTLTILDQVLGRTYPDTICVAKSIYDTHGFTIDPYLIFKHPEKKWIQFNVPYRCMLPRGLEGILVIGLGMSVHRDASPILRQQPDEINVGYAAGVAAAIAAKRNTAAHNIDLRELQQHLIKVGNLPESVLTDRDSFPLPAERIAAAVSTVQHDFDGVAEILANPQPSLPLLRKAYATAASGDKFNYAMVLAVLGDATGLETLLTEIRNAKVWDEGWRYRAGGQFGEALSTMDKVLIALGRTRDRRAVPVIMEKLKLLTPESEFSHHRAAALALELIGDPTAAPALAEALKKPGITGFAQPTIEVAIGREVPGGVTNVRTRADSLRELMLARALYRCGDAGGLGAKILGDYTQDLRGHLARHAQAVLSKSE